MDPFENSESLSRWVSNILLEAGIAEVAPWRMLEYWMQVELFRAVQTGHAGSWRHLGDYEQPYVTAKPRSGAKYNTKWVDLVLGEPNPTAPIRVAWIELKDIGRSPHTLKANAAGLGQDLAALYSLSPTATKRLWLDPPQHAMDRGRRDEWDRYAPALDAKRHLIAQIVLVPEMLLREVDDSIVTEHWLSTFAARSNVTDIRPAIQIGKAVSCGFAVFSVVAGLPGGG